jgi:penicillin-binding protein 1A
LNFFERLFGGKKQKKESEDTSGNREQEKEPDEDKGKSLLDRMKDIFRKKD